MTNKKCFVIMPFSRTKSVTSKKKWDEIYKDLFIPAWKEFDFECERTNVPRGSITKDIIEKLFSADIVFADLTDSNPNVMYELGVRHSFKKPSMMVKLKDCRIPFDVNDYKVHDYEIGPSGLRKLKKIIESVVKDLEKNPERRDNPVWDFLHFGGFMVDYYRDIQNLRKLESLEREIVNNGVAFDKVLNTYSSSLDPEEKYFRIMMIINSVKIDCLLILITTNYVSHSEDELELIHEHYDEYSLFMNFILKLNKPMPRNPEGLLNITFIKDSLEKFPKTNNAILQLIQYKIHELTR